MLLFLHLYLFDAVFKFLVILATSLSNIIIGLSSLSVDTFSLYDIYMGGNAEIFADRAIRGKILRI